MPFSSASGKDFIKWVVGRVPHGKMLDVGCGSGTYAKMFTSDWTGVEIWRPYVEKYDLAKLYNTLVIDDVRTYEPSEHYDVAIAGDVLEHMTPEEAQTVVSRLKTHADTLIVSIPIGHYPQDEYEGNPYEKHVKDDWTDADVRMLFGEPTKAIIDNEIGVYVWSKHDLSLRVAVYAISKNEEQFVERFCKSAEKANCILIADTGSTDGTAEKARECGAQVHDICITPWRFDLARNASVALIPRDIDVCISLDLDEVLEPGWLEELNRVWIPGKTTRLRYFFDWSCGIKFRSEKIHSRHGYFWHHPCHEYPVVDGRVNQVWAITDMLMVTHHPDPAKSRGQYLDILELSIKEDPNCPRNAFYYARELTFYSRWEDAIVALKKYLGMAEATWPHERCFAYRLLGKSYEELHRFYEAEQHYYRACAEAPDTREPWCALAMFYYKRSRWSDCLSAATRAVQINHRELVYTSDPEVWGAQPHDLLAISAWHMGMRDLAVEQGQLAVEKNPSDLRLRSNLAHYKAPAAQEDAA